MNPDSTTSGQAGRAQRLGGVLAPVLTPFRADLEPDPGRFARHCRWLLDHGCAALAPFGTTSEANSLSIDERERLLEALLEAGLPAERLVLRAIHHASPRQDRDDVAAQRRAGGDASAAP